jgi:[acyl-carrier-protein] S-malonyltransferase
VLCSLSLVIVAELCVLGIGVVRKLEVAAERTEQASRVYMAAVEAQAFGEQMRAREDDGAAHIGANAAAEQPAADPQAGDSAPPLPPRDVDTIVFDLTGELPDTDPGLPQTTPDSKPAATLPELKTNLAGQVAGSVRWEETVKAIVASGADTMIEFGPGNVLTGLLRRTLPDVKYFNINSVETLEAFSL